MRFFLSSLVMIMFSCSQVPLDYKLQYVHTSEERQLMEVRISAEVDMMYEGSLVRQAKFDTLIALNSEKEEYFRKKSFAYTRRGEFPAGFPLMQEAINLDPVTALYFTTWQMLFIYRDYERALADLEYYDDIYEGVNYVRGENVHYLKGLAYKQLGKYDQAIKEFDTSIKQDGANASEYVYVYRGIANLRHECLDDALMDFEEALSKDSNCTMAHVYMGETLLLSEQYEEAVKSLTKAEDLLCRNVKKTHPFFEVFDEVQLMQVYDLLNKVRNPSLYTN